MHGLFSGTLNFIPSICMSIFVLVSHCLDYVQFSSVTQSCLIFWDSMDYSTPVLPVHLQLPELAQIHVHRIHAIQPFHPLPSNHVIFCCPLLLLPSIFPIIRGLSNESVLCIRWPKYWPQLQHQFSNEYSGLISFRIDWFDLLTVQGTLKSPLQHHSSKASILWRSTFCIVQLSHPYMTTGKIIALTRWTFVGKVMCLVFSMLSRLVIAFFQGASVF